MEMNTRVQEHPVTEFVTGVDIVREQLKSQLARVSVTQEDNVKAMRLNAGSMRKILPSTFKKRVRLLISIFQVVGVGLRVDSAVYPGYTIPPYYDSMISKIIVHGENRFDTLMKMQHCSL